MKTESELRDLNSPMFKKKLPPGEGDTIPRRSILNEARFKSFLKEQADLRITPAEIICRLAFTPSFLRLSKEQEALHCVSELLVFLRRLQVELFKLSIKDVTFSRELLYLSGEAEELQRVARCAISYLCESLSPVKQPSAFGDNLNTELVNEGKSDSDADSADDVLNDIPNADVPRHDNNPTSNSTSGQSR